MSYIGNDQVALIKSRVDLVQLISDYTPLKKSGSNYTGCCCFHAERTPSLYVYPDEGRYKCFGCGEHGDAVELVMKKERLEFSDAVEQLARRVGHTIVYEKAGPAGMQKGDRAALLAAVDWAAKWYRQQLAEPAGAGARAYLAERGLTTEVCERFGLGWAPGHGQLAREAQAHGHSLTALKEVDLVLDRDGRLLDRFFDRITFPICDRFGQPIAFSARAMPTDIAAAKAANRSIGKYVNNSETPLFSKGRVVWNLHRARAALATDPAAKERNRLLLMEGQTDVMAASQAGLPECIGCLGTAFTSDHARQVASLLGATGTLYVVLDGDPAGVAAGRAACVTCLTAGLQARVVTLPKGTDPAELLAEGDRAA